MSSKYGAREIIYIGNLGPLAHPSNLKKFLHTDGIDVELTPDPVTLNCKGYGFIYTPQNKVEDVLKFNGASYLGRKLVVRLNKDVEISKECKKHEKVKNSSSLTSSKLKKQENKNERQIIIKKSGIYCTDDTVSKRSLKSSNSGMKLRKRDATEEIQALKPKQTKKEETIEISMTNLFIHEKDVTQTKVKSKCISKIREEHIKKLEQTKKMSSQRGLQKRNDMWPPLKGLKSCSLNSEMKQYIKPSKFKSLSSLKTKANLDTYQKKGSWVHDGVVCESKEPRFVRIKNSDRSKRSISVKDEIQLNTHLETGKPKLTIRVDGDKPRSVLLEDSGIQDMDTFPWDLDSDMSDPECDIYDMKSLMIAKENIAGSLIQQNKCNRLNELTNTATHKNPCLATHSKHKYSCYEEFTGLDRFELPNEIPVVQSRITCQSNRNKTRLFDENVYKNQDSNYDILSHRRQGINAIVIPGLCVASSKRAWKIAQSYPGYIFFTAGVHPHNARHWNEDSLAQIEELVHKPECVGVGEIGLDFMRNYSPSKQQIMVFEKQLELAIKYQKPLLLHERETHRQFMKVIEKYHSQLPPTVLHCFTGKKEHALMYLAMGFYIGVTGYIARPDNEKSEVRALLQEDEIPMDKLLLETDSPFMYPNTFQGDYLSENGLYHLEFCDRIRMEPCGLPAVVELVAACMKRKPWEVAESTTQNAIKFFNLQTLPYNI